MFALLSQASAAPQVPPQLGSHTHKPRVGSQMVPCGHAPPQVGSGSHKPVVKHPPLLAVFQAQPAVDSHAPWLANGAQLSSSA
jgi:hypothetical protein